MEIPDEALARLKRKLVAYKPSPETISLVRHTPKLFFAGISGAGKDTILHELLKDGGYHLIVSHTTRAPRANNGIMEQDGREYHFIDFAQAEHMLDTGAYIEAKMYSTNIYGTSAAEMKAAHDSGQTAVTDIEVQGVAEYMKMDPNTKIVFLLPPSYDVWQDRFKRRYGGTHNDAVLAERTRTALSELEHALATPYFHLVVNDLLPETLATVKAIAAGSEQPRQSAAAYKAARTIIEELHSQLSAGMTAA
jgi:guanylate kinase